MLFKVLDSDNNFVILSKNTWHDKLLDPIFGHPEVKEYLPQIKTAVSFPDYIYQSIRDLRSKLFFSKLVKSSFTSYFLCVVVKYVKEHNKTVGYVSTVMINRKLPRKSKLLWQKKVLT